MRKTLVEKHFDKVAADYDFYKKKNSFYYQNLKKLLARLIPRESRVLEIGCGTGDLVHHLRPEKGVGYDISSEMISISKSKYLNSKNLTFTTKWPKEKFDYIFMSDVIEHLEKPEKTLNEITKLMNKNTKLVITMANPLWEPILMIGEKLGAKMPEGPHKRIRYQDIKTLCKKAGMKVIKHDYRLLVPVKIPIITSFANKYLEKLLKPLCFIEYFVVTI